MITRSIDSNNDWNFGKDKQDYLADKEALPQNIKTRIQSFVGDCYFDLSAGVDWFNLLGTKKIDALKNAITRVILNTTGVLSLESLELSLDDQRRLNITYRVSSIWSTTINDTTAV